MPDAKMHASDTGINITGKYWDLDSTFWKCKNWGDNCHYVNARIEEIVLKGEWVNLVSADLQIS